MGITNLQMTKTQDSSRHSAMQITLLINVAAELHAIRLLLEDVTVLAPGQKDSRKTILEHSQSAFENHSKQLADDLFSDYQ